MPKLSHSRSFHALLADSGSEGDNGTGLLARMHEKQSLSIALHNPFGPTLSSRGPSIMPSMMKALETELERWARWFLSCCVGVADCTEDIERFKKVVRIISHSEAET